MPSALYCSHGLVPLSLVGVVGGGGGGGGGAFQEEELDDWSYSNNNDEDLCPVPYIAAMVSYH